MLLLLDIAPFVLVFAGLLGLGIGSFINVVVLRTRSEEKLTGRSHCPNCMYQLGWYDLLPVASYLLLRAKCRKCAEPISSQYPLIEAITAASFIIIAMWFMDQPLHMAIYFFYTALLIIIFVYDLKYYLILDKFTLPGIVLAFIGGLLLGIPWYLLLLSIAIGGGVFLIQFIVSRGKWIGGGDIRLGALMGAMLGWPHILIALFLSYVVGALISLSLIVVKQKTMHDMLPFGTFLALATFLTFIFGDDLLSWYVHEILKIR